MSDSTKQIIRHLHGIITMQEIADKAGLIPTIRAVQAWQCKRLLVSHQHMYQQKRFQPAVEFFINELYGPNDFSQRDQDIARIVPKMSKFLPEKALQSLASALHLNTLSFELDFGLANKLVDTEINRESYAKAYVSCDNLNVRQQQIDYIRTLGNDLAEVVKMKGISSLLFISRKPAKMAGVLALHEFLEKGFKAFKNIGNVEDFIIPVVNKEHQIMQQLVNPNSPNPLPDV
ncbi:hypothetical protein [Paraglaciecola sp. MB-3u-78]|jgi:hypothetical protein|uniref:FFLEELY motif protein n=1 Tax=Paraglaciecola sp. MB-3u-78 TaxID=2058332 RepID=UPI000C32123F|nr:hypothetical protein [Paraglaciecola sp. MB-3u-78]PKG92908.1 hypothetical protein CXF95_28430 [Paraglaciecola sp. MB-3u-78]